MKDVGAGLVPALRGEMTTKFINAKIMENAFADIYSGEVIVENEKIIYAGGNSGYYKTDKVIDVKQNLLMSGFCNTHCHSAMTLFRGIKDDAPLSEWLFDNIFKLEANLKPEHVYWGTMLAIAEYVRGGVTAFADMYYFPDEVVAAVQKSKMRAVLCGAVSDINSSYEKEIEKLESNYLKYNKISENINYMLGCHAQYTCSDNLICGISDLAYKYKSPTYIHLSETLDEVGKCDAAMGLSPPAYLHKAGFFDFGGIAAHCVHVDKDDIDLLKSKNVYASINCCSNLKLASGIPPVFSMQNRGLKTVLGTDGAASNNQLSMFKEMHMYSVLSKASMSDAACGKAEDSINAATGEGYKALNLNGGGIKAGNYADLIIVDLNAPNMRPINDIKSNLVFSADTSSIKTTMVKGNILYENGKYNIGENINDIYKNAEKCIRELKKLSKV